MPARVPLALDTAPAHSPLLLLRKRGVLGCPSSLTLPCRAKSRNKKLLLKRKKRTRHIPAALLESKLKCFLLSLKSKLKTQPLSELEERLSACLPLFFTPPAASQQLFFKVSVPFGNSAPGCKASWDPVPSQSRGDVPSRPSPGTGGCTQQCAADQFAKRKRLNVADGL